jgi:chaperonin GroEL
MGYGLSNNEVITGEESKESLIEGIDKLAEAVLATMGPMGRTVIISDEYGNPYITKDGVSVANAIKFRDPVMNIGAKLIKEVAQRTADEAGDGTTTSICLAQAFIRLGQECLNSEVSIVDLQSTIDAMVNDTVKELKSFSRKLRKKDIYKVASISANNDKELGKLIQKAYNHSNVVKVEEGKQKENVLEIVQGMTLPVTYLSPKSINNDKKQEVNYSEAAVLVLDKKLEDLSNYAPILRHCGDNNLPLVIFTEHISDGALRLLDTNIINGFLQAVVVKAPGFGTYRKDNLMDIASFTGATVITNDKHSIITPAVLGKTNNVAVGKLRTIIGKSPDVDVTTKISQLKESIKEAVISDYDREFLQDRITNLEGTLAIIKVGGTSEVEMKEIKDRADDAVLAVKSALEEGIVEGGGLALARVHDKLKNKGDKVYKTMINVLLAPSIQIFTNSSGLVDADLSKDRFKENIIDPFKVTRCALENAASVSKTILSTEAVVLNERLWN